MTRAKKIVLVSAVVMLLGVVSAVGTIAGIFWWYGRDVAQLDEDRLKHYRPSQVTRIYARDSELIGEIYTQRRTVIRYQDIPSHVENAFLAAEDADFYRHEGMDYFGMVRALFVNVRAGEIRQGASTITQQVVKIFMLSPERTFERKVQELILARRLERAFSKKEILELYLNEIYLGHGRYGIEEASRFYFGKSVKDIDLGQAALLATLPKAPGRDSPITNPARAKQRQRWVLQQMISHGLAEPDEAQPFIDSDDLGLADPETRPTVEPGAGEFVDAARAELLARYGAEKLDTLGAEVVTTVSLDLQRRTRAAVVEGLQEIDRRNRYTHGLTPASEEARSKARAEGQGRVTVGAVLPAVIEVRREGIELPADGFPAHVGDHDVFVRVPEGSRYRDPEQPLAAQFPPQAIVEVRIVHEPRSEAEDDLPSGWADAEIAAGPEAAAVVVDVDSGEVLAMVGGSRYGTGDFNRATAAKRQPGSAFKPFVYGAALLSRAFTAASIVSDSPEIYEKWKPTNFARDKYKGDMRVREALTHSVNTVAIKLADAVGIDAVREFARQAGIESELPANLSLALGTGEVTPFEMARAYLTLARGGNRREPRLIRSISVSGRAQDVSAPDDVQVFPEDVAFVLTSMMQSVVERGTATQAKALGRPAAGKTGTSADFHDAWFAGFTPRRVGVVWVGFDRPRKLGKSETGGKAAVPIWLRIMQAAEDGPPLPFRPPASVSVRRIDAHSGLLAPTGAAAEGYTGETLDEYFVTGTEPIDEAIPAALPAGDVLLDLYGEESRDGGAETLDGSDPPSTFEPAVDEPGPAHAGIHHQPPELGRGKLPSLDEGL